MLKNLKNFLSYIVPFVKRKETVYSGNMKIMFVNGEKKLNTLNDEATYSFGSLHRIMRFALQKTAFRSREDILLLGLGGWSAIELIRNELGLPNAITAVDIDPAIIEIARQEFNLDSYADTEIVCQDAYAYVQEAEKKYGLVIIDLFIGNKVPEKFYDDIFWKNTFRLLTTKGQIIFNTMIQTTDRKLFQTIIDRLQKADFLVSVHDKVDRTNMMVLAKRG